jgi:group I intron endonuclease
MGFIYKIVNKINDKIYIGQTTKSLDERWKQHKKKGSNCRYLKNAFEKYGINNFNFIMICVCFDEYLNKYEIEYINKFNSMAPNGYNLREGGKSGRQHEDTKNKISETLKNRTDIFNSKAQLGKHHTQETKMKISKKLKGRKDFVRNTQSWLGKTHTEESKKIMSEKHKIKINQYDLNNNFIQEYSSICEAGNKNCIDKSGIGKCCRMIRNTAGGFKWGYA